MLLYTRYDLLRHDNYPVQRVEVVWNGRVIHTRHLPAGTSSGEYRVDVPAVSDGWLAARLSSPVRDSFYQPLFAHTSPVYVETGQRAPEQRPAATFFTQAIDKSLAWVDRQGHFQSDQQRREVAELFKAGQNIYQQLGGSR